MSVVGKKPGVTREQADYIRDVERRKLEALAAFPTRKQLAEQFGVSIGTISNTVHRKCSKHHTHEARTRLATQESTT